MKSTDANFDPPRVDPEFLALLPVMDKKDDAELEFMLLQDGCREPIVVWAEENIIVEGHRRQRLCDKHKIPYAVEYRSFPSRVAIKRWMVRHQLYGRRNLTDIQRAYFIGDEYLEESAAEVPSSADVAKKNKVSRRKVFRDAKFARAAKAHEAEKPGTLHKILAGEAGTKSRSKIIKTAPIICDRCLRVGRPVKDCRECARLVAENAKLRKKPREDLFDEPVVKKAIAAEEPVDPWDELKGLVTKLAGRMTHFLTAEGEVAYRFCEYLGWCGLLEYPQGSKAAPKFIPLAGVRAIMEAAASKGPKLKQPEVQEMYQKACGAVPWTPPKTAYHRKMRGEDANANPGR